MKKSTYKCPKCNHEFENPEKEYGKTIINLFCEECCQRYQKLIKMRKLNAQKRSKRHPTGDLELNFDKEEEKKEKKKKNV